MTLNNRKADLALTLQELGYVLHLWNVVLLVVALNFHAVKGAAVDLETKQKCAMKRIEQLIEMFHGSCFLKLVCAQLCLNVFSLLHKVIYVYTRRVTSFTLYFAELN